MQVCTDKINLNKPQILASTQNQVKNYPEGGCTKSFGVVLTRVLEVLTILEGGGHKRFPPFKKEGGWVDVKSLILSVSDLQFSHFVAPPSP